MTCEEVRVLLEDGDYESEAAREHLRVCGECARYARTAREEDRILQAALAAGPDEARFQRVKARLSARLDRDDDARATSDKEKRNSRQPWRLALAAAALALGVCCWLLLGPAPNQDTPLAKGKADSNVDTASGPDGTELARLQARVRDSRVLDELEQLQIAFGDAGDSDARSAAEDAELYVERILSLDRAQAEQSREILGGIEAAGISRRLQEVRRGLARERDTPAPVLASLELAALTLDPAPERERSAARAIPPVLGPESAALAFAAADEKFRHGKYEEALASYWSLEKKHPGDWRAAQARFTAAFILEKKLKRPAQARREYEVLIDSEAASPSGPASLIGRSAEFHVARTFEASGETQNAIRGYERFLAKASRHPRAGDVAKKIEFLRRKEQGQGAPEDADAPGWAPKLDRKRWRKPEKIDKPERTDEPGEKEKRPKQTIGI